jgi:DNA-nicking Smr family endonuclease
MNSLDLHGVKHERARVMVIRFIEDNWKRGGNVEIITGHSNEMKAIVKEVFDEYKLEYKDGSFDGRNMGMIRTEI